MLYSFLFLAGAASSETRPELDETRIFEAERSALACGTKQISELFQLSADFGNLPAFDATLAEVLSAANERIIFKCPNEFLSTLENESHEVKMAVSYHIGVFEIEKLDCLLQAKSTGKHKDLIEKYFRNSVDPRLSCTENGA